VRDEKILPSGVSLLILLFVLVVFGAALSRGFCFCSLMIGRGFAVATGLLVFASACSFFWALCFGGGPWGVAWLGGA